MGVLNISTNGSFPHRNKAFKAMTHGHAHAVAEAIRYLSDEVLIYNDKVGETTVYDIIDAFKRAAKPEYDTP